MAGFSIKIGANAVEVVRSLAVLERAVKIFQASLKNATDPARIVALNQRIAELQRTISQTKGAQSIDALNNSLRQLPAGANQATTALGNLGRVASDAPFGFIAISNNIEPLIQSFVYLKQQSGSTGAAMKALGSSLLGGGGLLLAFSLATSALTFFAVSMGGAKKELQGFAKAQAEANNEAGEEIASLRVLASVAGNISNSIKDRKEATEQLQKALKANNIELSQEKILNNDAAAAIDLATQAILKRARARAIENRIAELTGQNLQRELDREDLLKKLQPEQEKYNKLLEKEKRVTGQPENVRSQTLNFQFARVKNITDAMSDLDAESKKANDEINSLITKAEVAPKGGSDPIIDLLKQRIDALKKLQTEAGLAHEQTIELAQLEIQLARRDGIKQGFAKQEIQTQVDAIIQKAFGNDFLDARFKLRVLGEIDATETKRALLTAADFNEGKPLDINAAFGLDTIDPTVFDPLINKMKEASEAKNELARTERLKEMGSFVANTLQPAFTELFEAIITGGNNAFQEFAKAIGRIIARLIAAVAAAATLAGIITLITGGSAAAFVGSFKSILGSLTGFKFAEGGIATRPTLGIFGEQGPEAVIPLARLPQIMGQANNQGGAGGEFTARIVDGGRDLILIMNRASKTYNRNF